MPSQTILVKLLPHEITARPVPLEQSVETLLSSCSKALETPISVWSTAQNLFPLYQPLVNGMYHNSAFREKCLPKCVEILEHLGGKIEDKRIEASKVLTRLYPSPDGSLDPLFDSLTLILQLCTLSQMHTLFRFYVCLNPLSLNSTYQLTSLRWFLPFFLSIVDYGMYHAGEDDKACLLDDITFCLRLCNYSRADNSIKFILTQNVVSFCENHRDLFIALRPALIQTGMSRLKWSVLAMTKQFQRSNSWFHVSSPLISLKADCHYLTLAMFDLNDQFRESIRDRLGGMCRRKENRRALESSGWEDALELQLTYVPVAYTTGLPMERRSFYLVILSLGGNMYVVERH